MLDKKKRRRTKLVERTIKAKQILKRIHGANNEYLGKRERGELVSVPPIYFMR